MRGNIDFSRNNIDDIINLSYMQSGMLFYYLANEQSDLYHEQVCIRLKGDIDYKLLETTWSIIVKNNAMMRTVFSWEKTKKPVQIILKNYEPEIRYFDYSKNNINREQVITEILEMDRNDKIDISSMPYRISLCKISENNYEMLITNHHILLDGWSTGIILRDFLEIYNNLYLGKEKICFQRNTYKSFIKLLNTIDKEEEEMYWRDYLLGYNSSVRLSPKNEQFNERTMKKISYSFSYEFYEDIKRFCRNNKITLATIIYSTWGILLQKYTDSSDIVFGTTVSGRDIDIKDVENIVGLFINTLPLRFKVKHDSMIKDMLNIINSELNQRKKYEHTSLIDIKSYVERNVVEELFDSIVVIENYPIDSKIKNEGNQLKIDGYSINEINNYDLTLNVITYENLVLDIVFDKNRFNTKFVERMLEHFKNVISSIITNCDKKIADIEIMCDEEKKRILNEFNNTQSAFPDQITLSHLFEEKVEQYPNDLAVISDEIKLTYTELNERVNQLARKLRLKGVTNNKIVGIMAERSVDMIIGIFAILKAGGAYLPIMPNTPYDRVNYIIENSNIELILTKKANLNHNIKVEEISLEDINLYTGDASNLGITREPSDLAYVIYTSGSTGTPKGVMIEHRAIVNRLNWMQKQFPIDKNDIILQKTSYTFDVSVWELFWWSIVGAKVYLLKHEGEKNPEEILEAICKNKITTIHFVPSMLNAFLSYIVAQNCFKELESLKWVFSSGEALSSKNVYKFYSTMGFNLNAKLINLYGPTEAAVDVTFYECNRNEIPNIIPIGKPIDNIKLYILDRNKVIQPIGIKGELYIGGVGLARGYLNRDDLTVERFILNPYASGEVLYKTGDIAELLEDGNVKYIGRSDNQVKIRGFRIELGEIENCLLSHKSVENVVVNLSDNNQIIAYVVPRDAVEKNQLKAYLGTKLPSYMIPTDILLLKELPVLSNGKIDRNKLPKVEQKNITVNNVKTSTQKQMISIWKEVLGVNQIQLDENFFDIGGNSILLIQVHNMIEKYFPKKVKITDLFKYTTINTISEFIDKGKVDEKIESVTIEEDIDAKDIAVIGINARLGSAENIEEFWQNIKNGKDLIDDIPEKRKKDSNKFLKILDNDKDNVFRKASYLKEIDTFDYKKFKISPKEASLMDPHQRLFLETAYHAIEDAGYGNNKLNGSKTGIFIGYSSDQMYDYKRLISEVDSSMGSIAFTGNLTPMIASRIAYILNLRGPSLVLDTACSSSLVALHLAYQSIKNGESDLAIAGGVKVNLVPIKREYNLGIESSDSKAKTFDDSSDGTGDGEGVAAVLLKPLTQALKDGDHIYGIIKGSYINQDGKTVGITAPSAVAQSEVIEGAWKNSGIDPDSISYIEAHGTGTALGDPIEIEGIREAFSKYTNKKQFCAVGSVKTNIGHLDAVAGIAGVIKVILMMKHKTLVPTLHFTKPNRNISFEESPLYVNDKCKHWSNDGKVRRCGVSSFGLSGTNCHMILEEFNENKYKKQNNKKQLDKYNILAMSSRNKEGLKRLIFNYKRYFENNENLDINSVCYTANTGRGHYEFRSAIIITSVEDAINKLNKLLESSDFNVDFEGIYRGKNSVLNNESDVKEIYEISLDQLDLISQDSNSIIHEIQSKPIDKFYELKKRLCRNYIKGAFIDWEMLYEGEEIIKTPIPLYPFERSRCWMWDLEEGYKHLYETQWVIENSCIKKKEKLNGTILVFKSDDFISERVINSLRSNSYEVIRVEYSDSYKKIDDSNYLIEPKGMDYLNLYKDIDLNKIKNILIFIPNKNRDYMERLSDLKSYHDSEVIGFFNLIKTLQLQQIKQNVNINVIGNNVNIVTRKEQNIDPQGAIFFAMAKVVNQENPQFSCKCIDIDYKVTEEDIISESMVFENNKYPAYRDGIRYIEQLKELNLEKVARRRKGIGDNGVYVISGGLGGVGYEIAKSISSKGKNIKLILLGRENLSTEDFEGIDSFNREKFNKLKALNKESTVAEYYSVDVSDYYKLEKVLEQVRKKYGIINGVIHAAGVNDDGFIIRKKVESITNVMAPKVFGTWNIDQLTSNDELDFFVLISSIVVLNGAPGQADYTAGNMFLNSFSEYRNMKGKETIVINWPTWNETGMAYLKNTNKNSLFKGLSNEEGIEILEIVLKKSINKIFVGEIDASGSLYGKTINDLMENFTFDINDNLKSMLVEVSNTKIQDKERIINKFMSTEHMIAEIWRNALGIDEFDSNDNFFEIGGDSIMLAKVHSMFEKYIPGCITVTDLFTYPTIKQLGNYIDNIKKESIDVINKQNGIEDVENEIMKIFDDVGNGEVSIEDMLQKYKSIEVK